MPKFILKITAESAENCIDEKNVECFILSASLPEDCLGRIIRKIEAAGKIALLEGEDAAALAVKLGTDGIVADLSASTAIKKEMATLRRQLGRRFLGVICRSRRHEAMIVSENEPDFVVFRIWSEGAEKTKAGRLVCGVFSAADGGRADGRFRQFFRLARGHGDFKPRRL